MTRRELYEFEQRIGQLPAEEQMHLIERLIRQLRQTHFTDHAAIEREMEAMAADPDIQREMNQTREVPRNAAG